MPVTIKTAPLCACTDSQKLWDFFKQSPIHKRFSYIDRDAHLLLKAEKPPSKYLQPYSFELMTDTILPQLAATYTVLGNSVAGVYGLISYALSIDVNTFNTELEDGWYLSPRLFGTRIPAIKKEKNSLSLMIGGKKSLYQNWRGSNLILYQNFTTT